MSASSAQNLHRAKTITRLALWTAVGVILAGLEHLLPQPLPWAKLGVANVVALLVLYLHGFRAALTVNVLRVLVVGLLLGSWATPVMLLSLGGALAAVLVMAALATTAGRWVGPVGVSAAGAFAHMATQFTLASVLIVRHGGLLAVAGPSLLLALVSGTLTGLLAAWLLQRLPAVLREDANL